jgi:hypothetical protein
VAVTTFPANFSAVMAYFSGCYRYRVDPRAAGFSSLTFVSYLQLISI